MRSISIILAVIAIIALVLEPVLLQPATVDHQSKPTQSKDDGIHQKMPMKSRLFSALIASCFGGAKTKCEASCSFGLGGGKANVGGSVGCEKEEPYYKKDEKPKN